MLRNYNLTRNIIFDTLQLWGCATGASQKISAKQPQDLQIDLKLCWDLNICVIFFCGKAHSALHSSKVSKEVQVSAGS